ncbi:avidin-like, partial [Protobothrops mucrosquamatus]|uniref:avidin-like n=1 Tax=Protobothrops mucrosquamatus TaxID=103944 RepID=UPI000775EB3F
CSLNGSWKNDLNSTMESKSVRNTGVLSGVYKTAVSGSGKPVPPSPLHGIQHQGLQPTFGFTCLVDNSGKDYLKTTWLLREKVGSAAKDWGATRIAKDTFYRT